MLLFCSMFEEFKLLTVYFCYSGLFDCISLLRSRLTRGIISERSGLISQCLNLKSKSERGVRLHPLFLTEKSISQLPVNTYCRSKWSSSVTILNSSLYIPTGTCLSYLFLPLPFPPPLNSKYFSLPLVFSEENCALSTPLHQSDSCILTFQIKILHTKSITRHQFI